MCDRDANPDVRVAEVATRQHGVVSVRQLREAGLDKHRVRHRVRTGRLHPVHRGVYAVGHSRLSPEGRWMAAVLACGARAVLSHRSAASLWGLLPDKPGLVADVSIPGDGGRGRRRNIRQHRCVSLRPEHVTRHRHIPTVTPSRTISDLRGVTSPTEMRRAIRQAEVLGLTIESDSGNLAFKGTRSELEFQFLRLCQRSEIPAPEVNVRVGSLLVDFLWPDRRLVVETDGYRYHRGRLAFENDRARDLELRARGYDVIRLTYRQVLNAPDEVRVALRRALGF